MTVQFVHQDPAMKQILSIIDRIAPSQASVLITGESGTGKEMIARYVHEKSKRRDRRLVAVNCAAIPSELIESELFGHEKGSFTGANARHAGRFEQASGSTLLLDEISEMHPRLQAKLLRAIQEREVDRIGGKEPISVDVRILATSNRNLKEMVRKGKFREDLYFRLGVINIDVPPLRKRQKDIMPLAEYFSEKYAKVNGIENRPFSRDAAHQMLRHPWVGNVRELENTAHRGILLAQGDEIDTMALNLGDFPINEQMSITPSETLVGMTLAEVERDLIIDTLHHCAGNRTHTFKMLGISSRKLRYKINQYRQEGIVVPGPLSE